MIAAQNTTQGAMVCPDGYIEKVCLEKDERAQRRVRAAPSKVYFQECSVGVYAKISNHLRCLYVFFQDKIKPLSSQFSLGKKITP